MKLLQCGDSFAFLLYIKSRKEHDYVGKIQQNQKNDRTVARNKRYDNK